MSGITFTPDVVAKYAVDLGYDIIADEYDSRMLVFPQLCDVIGVDAMLDPPFGHRASLVVVDGGPEERKPGEEHKKSAAGMGYDWQLAAKEYASAIPIPDEISQAAGGQRRVVSMVSEFTRTFARDAMVKKDKLLANMMQKGTLTAGDARYFDNSYVGKADPNPLFVYDGLPWFDTAHTLTQGGSTTYSNHTVSGALTTANLDAVLTTMTTTAALDERGEEIMLNPSHLIVPRGLRSTALQILNSESLPGSANNDTNPLRGILEPLVFSFLTDDADAWWVMQAQRGLLAVDSGAPIARTWRDEDRKTTFYGLSYRFGITVTDARYHHCANKAAS